MFPLQAVDRILLDLTDLKIALYERLNKVLKCFNPEVTKCTL